MNWFVFILSLEIDLHQ